MAIAITLRGFNDLGRSVTPFDGLFSLPFFYILRKYEENLSSRSFNFLQIAPTNSVHLISSLFLVAELGKILLLQYLGQNRKNW